MKIQFQNESSTAKKVTSLQSPLRVCMHVLGTARSDARVMREATALVKEGFAVSIVDVIVEGKDTQLFEEDIDGVCVKHILMPSSFVSTQRWSFIRPVQVLVSGILLLTRTPADIYHAHDEATLPACYIAAFLRRKPFIFDAHEFPLFQWPLFEMSLGRRFLHRLLTIFLAHVVPHCARVITVSPPIAQEMRNRYHGPEVALVRNVPFYQSVTKSDRLRQLLGLSPDVRIALYQGALMHNRSLDKLIHAARYLEQNIVIVMMGLGSQEILSQLETLIASEKVADRVKIIPAVPYSELLNWTSSADIGLIVFSPDYSPSIQMCLPNKLFEYLMAGLPVLASSLQAVEEVISTYSVGQVISSLAPSDIGSAINTMLADRVALACMRSNALDAAQQDLCWEKEKQRLIQLYHEILERGKAESIGQSLRTPYM